MGSNVILLGQEAEGSEAEGTHNAEITKVFQFTTTFNGGYADTLHIKFSASGTGTSGKLGVFTEGATKPVKLLTEGNLASVAVGEQKVEVTPFYIAPKTKYWAALLPLGGTVKLKLGKTTNKIISKTARKLLSENIEADWEAAALTGPMSIWVTGQSYIEPYPAYPPTFDTPSGLYKPFPPPPSFAGVIEEFLTAQLKGQVITADKVTAEMIAQAQAQAKEQFTQKVSATTNFRAGVVAQYRFNDGATVEVMSKVQALTKLQFVDTATPTAIMQVAARAKILIVDKASPEQVQQAAGKARLVFAGEAHTIKEGEEVAGKKVAIFIFED